MSEDGAAEPAELVFCGTCGADIDAAARFCRSCGADQLQFAKPKPEADPQPSAEGPPEVDGSAEPAVETGTEYTPAELAGLLDALAERHGFAASQPSPGDSAFEPGESSAIEDLARREGTAVHRRGGRHRRAGRWGRARPERQPPHFNVVRSASSTPIRIR